jgi:hypothetical protein
MEFARSLAFLPPDAADIVLRLTRVFYRIRFGDVVLAAPKLRRLDRAVSDLESLLPPARRRSI